MAESYKSSIKNSFTVQPIPTQEDVQAVRSYLKNRPRDLLLFDLITQTGLGINRLIGLKVRNLMSLKINEKLPIPGVRGKEPEYLLMTEILHKTFQWFIIQVKPNEEDFLLKSRKTDRPLNLSSISNMIKAWFEAVGLVGLSGARSLKKTWEMEFQENLVQIINEAPGDSIKTLQPAEVSTLQDIVYKELLQAIVSGKIPPGEKLTVEKIASQMKVSPMPVREAMAKLEATGFINTQRKKASFVNELSIDNLKEILAIRLRLETMAAEKACLNRTEKTILFLEKIHQQFETAVDNRDVDTFFSLNKQFHHGIYKDAHMPILQQILESLWHRVSPYLHMIVRMKIAGISEGFDDGFIGLEKHAGMLKGMQEKDPKKVCLWLERDLKDAAEIIISFLNCAQNKSTPKLSGSPL